VYDPQSPFSPEPFWANGSAAKELAIVANEGEMILLGEDPDPLAAARKIVKKHPGTVVFLKRGSLGAYVVARAGEAAVSAYQLGRIYGIGSGDIFTSAIALHWGLHRADPIEAADLASRSAAHYCHSRSLPLPTREELLAMAFKSVGPLMPDHMVYLAGPFFNLAQRWLVEEVRDHLRMQGLKVFSPLHDVGIGPGSEIAEKDLQGLEKCDRVLALLDGADLGTVFEVGYARKMGIPVVVLAQQLTEESLKMITGSGCDVVNDFATAIYHTAWIGRV
jgi:nucleoside 2-deoxyribosyltransferase